MYFDGLYGQLGQMVCLLYIRLLKGTNVTLKLFIFQLKTFAIYYVLFCTKCRFKKDTIQTHVVKVFVKVFVFHYIFFNVCHVLFS